MDSENDDDVFDDSEVPNKYLSILDSPMIPTSLLDDDTFNTCWLDDDMYLLFFLLSFTGRPKGDLISKQVAFF